MNAVLSTITPEHDETTSEIAGNQPQSHEAIRAQVHQEMKLGGLSQAQVATESGISAAILSPFLKGKYQGDNDQYAAKLQRWLHTRRGGEELRPFLPIAPTWIETPTALSVIDGLRYAQLASDVACIYGGAGLGKSSAVARYANTNSSVWLVTATPATASVGVILEEIALALGMRDFALHPARLQREILRRVRGTQGLLIIDEAQHLTIQALEAVRSIHDAAGIGLALCGNAAVYGRLTGNTRADSFAQLFSRIGKRVALSKSVAGDVIAIAHAFKVTGKREIASLQDIAKRPGALRGVVKTLRLASMYAAGKIPPVEIGDDDIRAAWNELSGGSIDA